MALDTVPALLRRRHAEILRVLEELANAEVRHFELSRLALRGGIPQFLSELAAWVESGEPPGGRRLGTQALGQTKPVREPQVVGSHTGGALRERGGPVFFRGPGPRGRWHAARLVAGLASPATRRRHEVRAAGGPPLPFGLT